MGGKGSKTQTATSTNAPPPEVLANYNQITQQAKNVAATPYTPYGGQMVAPINQTEQAGIAAIPGAATAYQPYYGQAQGLIGQGTQQYSPTQFSSQAVGQYESPYTQDVINSTLSNINQENQKQQTQLQGNAIASGAWGGDRADLARNDLARQQGLATGQTIAGLENQNYSQALNQFNTANQTGLQAAGLNAQTALQGAGLQGAMGNYASQLGLAGANAQVNAGALQQQTAQNADTAAYQQFLQQQAYPFKTTQYLADILNQGAGTMGGTSSTTQPNQNYQSPTQSILGTGLAAAGLFLKDGGSVDGYAPGGSITNLPDFGTSYIPLGSSGSSGSSIPQAPVIQQAQHNFSPVQAGLGGLGGAFSGGKDGSFFGGLRSFGSGIMGGSGLKESTGYGMNSSGYGSQAYDMLDFAKGGTVGYARGGWENQPLFDSPMYSTPESLSAEERGILPTGGSVGGLPLSPEMNNRLAQALANESGVEPLSESPKMASDSFGNVNKFNPMPGFKDPTNTATPEDMQALMGGVNQAADIGGIPSAPQVAQNNTVASDAPQGIVANQPPALTNLQKTLANNAPELDKSQALLAAGAAIMQGGRKNVVQSLGSGLQAGLENLNEQKKSVRDYALKQAEVEKQAQQMAMEAQRYNKQLEIEQQNADTNKAYKDVAAKVAQENANLKDIIPIKDAMGQQHLVKKSDFMEAQKNGDIAGAQNEDGSFSVVPDKAKEAYKVAGLTPTPKPINKYDAKALRQHYDDAVKADEGARDASVMIDKIYPAFSNYTGGVGSGFRAGAMTAAASLFNSKAPDFVTNAQEINKVSGTLATQLAAQMPSGSRVGIGVDNLFKSTTISPDNTPEANAWIAKNIKDAPAVTSQMVALKSYLNENGISSAHADALQKQFLKENPIMVPSGAGKNIDKVNPKFQDPQFFFKWLSGQSSGNSMQPPQNHIQKLLENKNNPKAISDFDEKYGQGAAAKYLGQ